MLNKAKHQLLMTQILKEIYSDIEISSTLGFKGGTCAYFFYHLPRFSVDLDFDLIQPKLADKQAVFDKIENILKKFGTIKEQQIKRWTIFFLLSYGDEEHNIKIEISTRENNNKYEPKEYLGIAMFGAKKETLFANKLAALIGRKNIAMRDVYDVYYFAKNSWEIDEEVLKFWTGRRLKEQLKKCLETVEKINDRDILRGLGEVLDEKEKNWAKKNLKKEVLFLLKNYLSVAWMKKFSKIIYNIFIVCLAMIAILLVVSVLPITRLFGGQAGNFKILTVLSGSMEPEIHTGSIVAIKSAMEYKIGDIITFGKISKTQTPTTHRIFEIKDNNGQKIYITKGDANNSPDMKEVLGSEVVGKVIFSVPYLGYAVDFAKKPFGFMLIIVIPAAAIIFDEVRKIKAEVVRLREKNHELWIMNHESWSMNYG